MSKHLNLRTKKDFGLTIKKSFSFTLLIAFIMCGVWIQNAAAQVNIPSGKIVVGDVVPSPVIGTSSEVKIYLNDRVHVEEYQLDLELKGRGFQNATVTYDGGSRSLTTLEVVRFRYRNRYRNRGATSF